MRINAYHSDSSAAITKDGELLAAIEEERIRRIKHWVGLPGLPSELREVEKVPRTCPF